MPKEWLKPEKLTVYLLEGWEIEDTGNDGVLQLTGPDVNATLFLEDQSIDVTFFIRPPYGSDPEAEDVWTDAAEAAFDMYAREDWSLVGFEPDGPADLNCDMFEIVLSRKFETIGELQAIMRWLEKIDSEIDMDEPFLDDE